MKIYPINKTQHSAKDKTANVQFAQSPSFQANTSAHVNNFMIKKFKLIFKNACKNIRFFEFDKHQSFLSKRFYKNYSIKPDTFGQNIEEYSFFGRVKTHSKYDREGNLFAHYIIGLRRLKEFVLDPKTQTVIEYNKYNRKNNLVQAIESRGDFNVGLYDGSGGFPKASYFESGFKTKKTDDFCPYFY